MSIIVGDIHGNVEKVKAFLAYRPDQEHVALGDYLDSFSEPQNRQLECLKLLLKSDAVLLWGNHDLHYLDPLPPFICTGFQYGKEDACFSVVTANKNRFRAAHVTDGWLCTHAGCHIRLAKRENPDEIAARFNENMAAYIEKPYEPGDNGIFASGQGRGGSAPCGGIFWHDFKRENGLATDIRQIFGHTEISEPVVTDNYVALDTTNNKKTVFLFDTETGKMVWLHCRCHTGFKNQGVA